MMVTTNLMVELEGGLGCDVDVTTTRNIIKFYEKLWRKKKRKTICLFKVVVIERILVSTIQREEHEVCRQVDFYVRQPYDSKDADVRGRRWQERKGGVEPQGNKCEWEIIRDANKNKNVENKYGIYINYYWQN